MDIDREINMATCQRILAIVWFIPSAALFGIFVIQTILGRYGDQVGDAWNWLLPTIMPTLSLVIGALVTVELNRDQSRRTYSKFMLILTSCISVVYLASVSVVVLFQPISPRSPLDSMRQANLWLGPLQGLVAGAMGAFFAKSSPSGARDPGPRRRNTEAD
jgi:hypothetical protein